MSTKIAMVSTTEIDGKLNQGFAIDPRSLTELNLINGEVFEMEIDPVKRTLTLKPTGYIHNGDQSA